MSAWYAVSAVLLALVAVLVVRVIRDAKGDRGASAEGDETASRVPLTLLQERALAALVTGTLTLLIVAGMFIGRGPEQYYTDDAMRVTVYLVFLAGLAVYGAAVLYTSWKYRGVPRDERDEAVLHWAPTVQAPGMSLALAVWAIGLTETYWETGSVPIVYPMLIFVSTIVVGLLFRSLGIVIGYRRF
jgi:hypothetical protein